LPGSRRTIAALTLAAAVAGAGELSAHRLDEYLQAARVGIEPDRVELELEMTPGVGVAGAILAEIDADGDGALSDGEQRAYAHVVVSAIRVQVDGMPVRLEPADSTFAGVDALRRGEGTIRLRSAAALPGLSSGNHRLVLRNDYRPRVSAYLSNALVPVSPRVAVVAQARDADQSRLTVDYVLRPETSRIAPWVAAALAALGLGAAIRFRPSFR
jgi:hypothetical protein